MSRYHGRHRRASHGANHRKRTASAAGLGVLTMTAMAGTSATAWACPGGSHDHARASVHRAVAHGTANNHSHATEAGTTHAKQADRTGTSGAINMRGASRSNPDGTTNGGADKPSGAAAANDDVDGNNGCGHAVGHKHAAHVGRTVDIDSGSSGATQVEIPGIGAAEVTIGVNDAGMVTIVVTRPNGDVVETTVPVPPQGQSTAVPVTVHGATVVIDVSGTTAGVQVASSAPRAGGVTATAASQHSPSTATTVLGERFSRGLLASGAPTAAGVSAGAQAPARSAASVTPTSTALPFTGSEDLPLIALVGGSALVTGLGLVRAARRRPGEAAA